MRRHSWLTACLWATAYALVALAAWTLLLALVLRPWQSTPSVEEDRHDVLVRRDGALVLSTRKAGASERLYTDLAGKPLKPVKGSMLDYATLLGPSQRKPWWQAPDRPRAEPIRLYDTGHTVWYVLHNWQAPGTFCLVEYSRESRRPLGYCGRQGFSATLPPAAACFTGAGRAEDVQYSRRRDDPKSKEEPLLEFTADGAVWEYDTHDRRLSRRAALPGVFSRSSFRPRPPVGQPYKPDGPPMPATLVLRNADHLRLVDAGGQVRDYMLPTALRPTWSRLYFPDDGTVVAAYGEDEAWLRFDATGRVLDSRPSPLPRPKHKAESAASDRRDQALVLSLPLAVAINAVVRHDRLHPWATVWADARLPLIVWGAVALLCVVAMLRRQRRYGLGGSWLWVPFVLLGGWPAYVGYRQHRRPWPSLTLCQWCGERVPAQRDTCQACGGVFAVPEANGLEVLDR